MAKSILSNVVAVLKALTSTGLFTVTAQVSGTEKRKLVLFCPLQHGALGQGEEPEWLGRVVCCQQAPPQTGQPCHCW